MGKGAETRERILEIAEASVLAKGFGATSIEEIIAEAGITKSGFFYHFRDKNELAREMLRRYVEANDRLFDDIFGRGRAALRRPAAGLPDQPEAAGRNHGRSAQRPSRLPDRLDLLPGAAVRPRGARPHRPVGQELERALPRLSRRDRRASTRRARPSISTISPTCSPASSTAASSCPRPERPAPARAPDHWPSAASSSLRLPAGRNAAPAVAAVAAE